MSTPMSPVAVAKKNSLSIKKIIKKLLWPERFTYIQVPTYSLVATMIASCTVNYYLPICFQNIGKNCCYNDNSLQYIPLLTSFKFALNFLFCSVDSLTKSVQTSSREICWDLVLVSALLTAFQGTGTLGLESCIQRMCWLPIEQHLRLEIQVSFLCVVMTYILEHDSFSKDSFFAVGAIFGTDALHELGVDD